MKLCDLSNVEQRSKITEELSKETRLWGLVNNASGPSTGSIESSGKEDYLKALETHLFASDDLVKAILPQLKRNGGGRIVNIISGNYLYFLKSSR